MAGTLVHDLHKLTSLLDRAADGLLREHAGISYSRFLALFAVRESAGSQRDLARWLGLTEPSASRMVGVLADDGLVSVAKAARPGNRRQLELTRAGAELVDRCADLLVGEFDELVRLSRVPLVAYHRHTRRLLEQVATYATSSERGGVG